MYLDTMQKILGQSNKVLVDVKGGNNLIYLPLDQLMKRRNSPPTVEGPSSGEVPQLGRESRPRPEREVIRERRNR
jgi:membrane protease subunit HflK